MRSKMTPTAAETLALKALGFLANSPGALERFAEATGIGSKEMRTRAAEPEFLAAIVDFLLSEEERLKEFCHSESLDSRDVHLARYALPGG